MSQRNITAIGMCWSECNRSEGVHLKNGGDLKVNTCPSGDVCIQFCRGLAARYTKLELEDIGGGNDLAGVAAAVREIRTEPDAFQLGLDRPFNDSLA